MLFQYMKCRILASHSLKKKFSHRQKILKPPKSARYQIQNRLTENRRGISVVI